MPSPFKESIYNILTPLDGCSTLVYNSFSGALALFDDRDLSIYDAIAQGKTVTDSAVGGMLSAGFVVYTGTDETGLLERKYYQHRFDESSMLLTIAPTLSCNFDCDYCFQGSQKPSTVMSAGVQSAIVALLEGAKSLRRLHVTWYGGEPLLQPRIIADLSRQLAKVASVKKIAFDAMIVTNGYLLDEHMAASLWRGNVKIVQITLDGDQMQHDSRRKLRSGKPTFETIIGNIQAVLVSTPLRINIRVNIDSRNHANARSLIEHLAGTGLAGNRRLRLYFAPVEAITDQCHGISSVCMSKSSYGEREAELYRLAVKTQLCERPYPPRFRGTCAAVRPRGYVILPDGTIHKCWDTITQRKFACGNVLDFSSESTREAARVWLDWSPFKIPECRRCKLLPVCAGACAYKFLHSPSIHDAAARSPCLSWKENIRERLALYAENP